MRGSRVLSIVLSLALALTLLPFGAFHASAANASVSLVGTPYTYINEKTVDQPVNVYFKIDPAAKNSSSALLRLVDDNGKQFKFTVTTDTYKNLDAPPTITPKSGTTEYELTVQTKSNEKNEWTLRVTPDRDQDGVGSLYLVVEPKSPSDEFSFTQVKVGVFSTKDPDISVVDKDTVITDGGKEKVTLRLSEPQIGVFSANQDKTIRVTLPDGFKWDSPTFKTILGASSVGNFNDLIDVSASGKDLNISFKAEYYDGNTKVDRDDVFKNQTERLVFEVSVTVIVDKSYTARKGDVTVSVSNAEPRTLVIGKYGEYEVNVYGEPEDIWAGRKVQTGDIAGKIVLDELVKGSLVQHRTIKLVLPPKAEWPENWLDAFNLPTSNKAKLDFRGYEYLDGKKRVAKFAVLTPSSTAGKTVIEVKQVYVEAGFPEGPLTVQVEGSAVSNTNVTVANVKPIVSVSAENKRDVVIGAQDQPVGDIVIKENVAGALKGGKTIVINKGDFVSKFTAAGSVEVRKGNIELGAVRLENSDTEIWIEVRKASSEPSEIVIKGARATISRTAPEGDLELKVMGSAVVDSDEEVIVDKDSNGNPRYFDFKDISVYPVRVVTPADKTKAYSAKFTIDSMSYVVNGETKAMDVAPFIQDNRTFVPVRYVAEALGVKDTDIIWNPYAKSVTIFKGDRVIQMKIGSKTLVVNGSAIEMDTAPVIKDARTVLPIAWVAKALNVDYVWNDAERSVEFNYTAQ